MTNQNDSALRLSSKALAAKTPLLEVTDLPAGGAALVGLGTGSPVLVEGPGEVFFDLAPEYLPAAHAQAYTPQTFRLFVTPRGTEKLHVMGAVKPDDCKLDVKQSADGYSFKLEIRAATGKMLGFDVKIDDAGNGKIRETTLGKGKELYRNRCNFSIVK